MTPEQLMQPRYEVIADYPFSQWSIGNVIQPEHDPQVNLPSFPAIFRKLQWWEHRTVEVLKSIKYVKVVTYRAYYLVGDVVPVEQFEGGSVARAKPTGFYLSENENHFHGVFDVEPATKQDYLNFKNNKQ